MTFHPEGTKSIFNFHKINPIVVNTFHQTSKMTICWCFFHRRIPKFKRIVLFVCVKFQILQCMFTYYIWIKWWTDYIIKGNIFLCDETKKKLTQVFVWTLATHQKIMQELISKTADEFVLSGKKEIILKSMSLGLFIRSNSLMTTRPEDQHTASLWKERVKTSVEKSDQTPSSNQSRRFFVCYSIKATFCRIIREYQFLFVDGSVSEEPSGWPFIWPRTWNSLWLQ